MIRLRPQRFLFRYLFAVLLAALLSGCGKSATEEHAGHEHGHEEESPSGATFKAGKGVILTDETRQILGVEVVEVTEQKLPAQVHFNLQIFNATRTGEQSSHEVLGSAFLPSDKVAGIHAGDPVQAQLRTNEILSGTVLSVKPAQGLGETEVLVGLANAGDKLKPGEFISASVISPRDDSVIVIPHSALLHTAEGAFVYTANGDAYFRTAVKTGAEAGDHLEITDGLLAGDVVVAKPVETFYLIELRATKGGGHCH